MRFAFSQKAKVAEETATKPSGEDRRKAWGPLLSSLESMLEKLDSDSDDDGDSKSAKSEAVTSSSLSLSPKEGHVDNPAAASATFCVASDSDNEQDTKSEDNEGNVVNSAAAAGGTGGSFDSRNEKAAGPNLVSTKGPVFLARETVFKDFHFSSSPPSNELPLEKWILWHTEDSRHQAQVSKSYLEDAVRIALSLAKNLELRSCDGPNGQSIITASDVAIGRIVAYKSKTGCRLYGWCQLH